MGERQRELKCKAGGVHQPDDDTGSATNQQQGPKFTAQIVQSATEQGQVVAEADFHRVDHQHGC